MQLFSVKIDSAPPLSQWYYLKWKYTSPGLYVHKSILIELGLIYVTHMASAFILNITHTCRQFICCYLLARFVAVLHFPKMLNGCEQF